MNLSLVDTHTHLYYTENQEDLANQLERCRANDVDYLILPNVDIHSVASVFKLQEAYPDRCFAMMGLHPCSVKEDYQEQLEIIGEHIHGGEHRLYAIGEIGLDLYWDASTLPQQQDAFRRQVAWAKDLGLPVSIHCREAYNELFSLLDEVQDGRLTGVLHCFTGTEEQAWHLINMGLHLGIGGVVTFKNAGLDRVVEKLPLAHLVLETDSPYLAPTPYRGKPNESSYLLHIAEKVADLQGVSLEEVSKVTTATAKRIFGLDQAHSDKL